MEGDPEEVPSTNYHTDAREQEQDRCEQEEPLLGELHRSSLRHLDGLPGAGDHAGREVWSRCLLTHSHQPILPPHSLHIRLRKHAINDRVFVLERLFFGCSRQERIDSSPLLVHELHELIVIAKNSASNPHLFA